jgi:hypothetical protein
MRATIFLLTLASAPLAAQNIPPLAPGTYTNEEEVYFAKEAKKPAAPWTGIAVDATGTARFVDLFGKTLPGAVHNAAITKDGAIAFPVAGGVTTILRRSRPVTCWGSVPKTKKKPDGSDDWYFVSGLKLHDQGGRALFGGGDTGAPPVIIRMRNVIWPMGTNKPSLVLYVHKPENPDHAESYSWADPDAKRVGINLRWMQASCSID